jgi:hypothetical protein
MRGVSRSIMRVDSIAGRPGRYPSAEVIGVLKLRKEKVLPAAASPGVSGGDIRSERLEFRVRMARMAACNEK